MKRNKYNQIEKSELDHYLWSLDADKEERRCARMWVRDGHWIHENDHDLFWGEEPEDFLSASRAASFNCRDYTDSFYDVKTQEYIRRQNLTEYEKRKLRTYIREGGRFCDEWMQESGFDNYISYMRDYEVMAAAMFSTDFRQELEEYAGEFIFHRQLTGDFIRYIAKKR